MSKLDNRSASLRFYDEDSPNFKFVKQITKYSKNNNESKDSAACFKEGSMHIQPAATTSNIKFTKGSTFQNIINLPAYVNKTHSEFANSVAQTEGGRADYFGNKITKPGKKHRIVFSDHIGKGNLIEVVNIANIKNTLSTDNCSKKNKGSREKQNNAEDREENCSCLCSIF